MNDVIVIAGLGEKKSNNGTQWFQQDRIYDIGGVAPALMRDKSDLLIQVGQLYGTDVEPNPQAGRVYDPSGLSPTLDTWHDQQKIAVKNATPTLDTKCEVGVVEMDEVQEKKEQEERSIRIRKLTPKECFRLQGFPDDYYERAAEVNSDSQLYRQAGNAVTVNVIYEIAKRME